jgi:hypothetical protein
VTVIRGTARSILAALPEGHVGGHAVVAWHTPDEDVRELEARGVTVERSPWVEGVWQAWETPSERAGEGER